MPSTDVALVCDFSRSFIRWRNDTTKKPMVTVTQPPPTTRYALFLDDDLLLEPYVVREIYSVIRDQACGFAKW